MEYLKEKAEGYVAQWIMKDPDAINQVDAYWFYSMVGKAIVWSVIKARKEGQINLDTIKANCEWSRTRAKPEYFDLVYNQTPISDEALQYCINYFKLMGMITQLKESEIDGKVKFNLQSNIFCLFGILIYFIIYSNNLNSLQSFSNLIYLEALLILISPIIFYLISELRINKTPKIV